MAILITHDLMDWKHGPGSAEEDALIWRVVDNFTYTFGTWANMDCGLECLPVVSPEWQRESHRTYYMAAQGSQRVLQETGRESCHFLETWALRLAEQHPVIFYWSKQSQSLPRFQGRGKDPTSQWKACESICSHL